jgi:hypothetical protein
MMPTVGTSAVTSLPTSESDARVELPYRNAEYARCQKLYAVRSSIAAQLVRCTGFRICKSQMWKVPGVKTRDQRIEKHKIWREKK